MTDELTKYGFISHMEAYLKDLINNYKAQPDDYLKSHGIDGQKALSILLKRSDDNDPESAVVIRKEWISSPKDENGNKQKDRFNIKYRVPRKNYWKKMEKLFDTLLNEEDGGGATACASAMGDGGSNTSNDGQYVTPLTGGVIKRKIKEEAGMDTAFGDFGYDAPAFSDPETSDHKDMMKKSFNGYMKEKGVNYAKKPKKMYVTEEQFKYLVEDAMLRSITEDIDRNCK